MRAATRRAPPSLLPHGLQQLAARLGRICKLKTDGHRPTSERYTRWSGKAKNSSLFERQRSRRASGVVAGGVPLLPLLLTVV